MKLAGAILLVLSGVIGGALGAARLQRRVRMLRDLKMLMQAFQTGIRFAAASLPELILEYQDFPFAVWRRRTGSFSSIPPEPWRGRGVPFCGTMGTGRCIKALSRGWASATFRARWSIWSCTALFWSRGWSRLGRRAKQKSKVFVALGLFAGVTLSLLLL